MSPRLDNNFCIYSLGIMFVLQRSGTLSLPEILLVAPFVSHAQLLNYLARKSTDILSLEHLIVKSPSWFSNFNERYYDGLTTSVNAIQFLCDIESVRWDGKKCTALEKFDYESRMGSRAGKMHKAAGNIEKIISQDVASAYTNLRIQL